jgi:glycine cleavage system H protein
VDPKTLKYTRDHEWVSADGAMGTLGISDHAQGQLGDVVYLELPRVGVPVKQGEPFGGIESVKTYSDLYSPVSGEVTEVNQGLEDHPEWVNQDPYGQGWMMKVRLSDPAELDGLMEAEEYESYLGSLED